MTTLVISEPEVLDTSTFWWRNRPAESSFMTNIDPDLHGLGHATTAAVDLVRIAAAVYLTDRTTPRRRGWMRSLDVTVELADPVAWVGLEEPLAALCSFLSGDDWAFEFAAGPALRKRLVKPRPPIPVVSLLSGGADSFCGALLAHRRHGQPPHVVSHWDSNQVSAAQTRAVASIATLTKSRPTVSKIRLGRRNRQLREGGQFGVHLSSRSRSLLFLALGAAVAGPRQSELWIPENGFLSLNIPLAPERRSSLSTRTTHPQLLETFNDIVAAVGIDVRVSNPFETRTKGEMVAEVAETYGDDGIRAMMRTSSCAKPDLREYVGKQCGVCYACIVRRGAFHAAGINDTTPYVEPTLTGRRRSSWLYGERRLAVEAVRYAVTRGFDLGDVLELGLPSRYSASAALDLARRGLGELALVEIA